MWIYEKKLEFPVKIKTPNAKLAQLMIEQYGGPDGSGRYRFPATKKDGANCQKADGIHPFFCK